MVARFSSATFRWFVTALVVAVSVAMARADDGDIKPRTPFLVDSTSKGPSVESSPAVATDGTVYLGVSYSSGAYGGAVFAYTPNVNGLDLKWPEPHRFEDNVTASPAIGGDGNVYVGSVGGVFYCLNKDSGAEVWSYATQQLVAPDFAFIDSSAAFSPDGATVYVIVEAGTLSELHAAGLLALTTNGAKRWFHRFPDQVFGSPAVASDGTIYVGCDDGNLYAINPDETERWHVPVESPISGTPAIAADGTIYVGTLGGSFVAVKPSGQIKWSRSMSAIVASAVVGIDGTIYIGAFGDATLYALSPIDGKPVWSHTATTTDPTLQAITAAAPVVRADGTIIYAGIDDTVRAFKRDGTTLWVKGPLGRSPFEASPVISPTDHTIYAVTLRGNVYAFSGNEYGVSGFASWPMLQHDPAHTGRATRNDGGGRLMNLSTRGEVGPGLTLISGLFFAGPAVKTALVRAVGPTLALYGVGGALPDPSLSVHVANAYQDQNDNWGTDAVAEIIGTSARVGAFPLTIGSKDAARIEPFVPEILKIGTYTITVDSTTGERGVAMLEVYDADPIASPTRLTNLSTRGHVGIGEHIMISGLSIGGDRAMPLLIRAVGPGLSQFNVGDALQRPKITLVSQATGQEIVAKAGWENDTFAADLPAVSAAVGAFPLAAGSGDTATIVFLAPGLYTIKVSGADGGVGNALVEIYDLSFQ